MPNDFKSWLQSLDAEFKGRLLKMIRGPMWWSGQPVKDHGNPKTACVNIAVVSSKSITNSVTKLPFDKEPVIQVSCLTSYTNCEVMNTGLYMLV